MKELSPSTLRADLYRVLDQILDSGAPVEILRRGRRLRIVPEERRLDLLEPHPDAIQGDPEDLVHMDWSGEWQP